MATIIGTGLEQYLHRQARERAMNRIAEAREEARQITEAATREAERVRREAEERTARTIEERRRRATAQALLKAKLTFTRRRGELMEQVFAEAVTRLTAQEERAARLATLARLLDDAARQLEGGPLEVQCNAEDQALLDQSTLAHLAETLAPSYGVTSLTLASTPAASWGGVIVRRTDKSQFVENSFNERLALARRLLRDEIYHLLSPATTGPEA